MILIHASTPTPPVHFHWNGHRPTHAPGMVVGEAVAEIILNQVMSLVMVEDGDSGGSSSSYSGVAF